MTRKEPPERNALFERYITRSETMQSLADSYGVSIATLRKWLLDHGIQTRRRGTCGLDLSGKRYGKTLVVSKERDEHGRLRWRCRCDCGFERLVKTQSLNRGEVMSCGRCGEGHNWKGCGELPGSYFCGIKISARNRGIAFDLTKEELWSLFLKQTRRCALSGAEIYFGRRGCRNDRTASLDRVDSNGTYHINNVQWVHRDVNYMKMDLPEDLLTRWVKRIYEFKELGNSGRTPGDYE